MKGRLPLRHRRGLLCALVFSSTCLFAPAQAVTDALINNINVNTTADEFGSGGSCSLREAVQSANGDADFGGCNSSGIYGNDVINIPALMAQPPATSVPSRSRDSTQYSPTASIDHRRERPRCCR